jgi:DNA-binding protein Alba
MTENTKENIVLIGTKPVMNYVVACMTTFNAGANNVTLKARGRATSRAVDIVEVLRHSFIKDLSIDNITIGTEELKRYEGQTANVSTIEIAISKPK